MIKFDDTTRLLEASLTLRAQRQDLLASNIVNADTPHYRARDLTFEGFLQDAQEGLEQEATTSSLIEANSEIHVSEARPDTLDDNGVNRDEAIGKSAENLQRFGVALELVRRKMAMVRYAITGADGG